MNRWGLGWEMFKGMYIKPEGDVLKDVLVSIIWRWLSCDWVAQYSVQLDRKLEREMVESLLLVYFMQKWAWRLGCVEVGKEGWFLLVWIDGKLRRKLDKMWTRLYQGWREESRWLIWCLQGGTVGQFWRDVWREFVRKEKEDSKRLCYGWKSWSEREWRCLIGGSVVWGSGLWWMVSQCVRSATSCWG